MTLKQPTSWKQRTPPFAFTDDTETGHERVTAFLSRLSEFPQFKIKTIQEFETWIFVNRHLKLSETTKFSLVVGNDNNGLIFEIGSVDRNPLNNVAALRFLRKLLHHEYCSEADQYRTIVSQLDAESYLQAMELNRFFHWRFSDARMDVCQILEALSQANPNFDARSALSNDEVAIQEYENWIKLNRAVRASRYLFPKPLITTPSRTSHTSTTQLKDIQSAQRFTPTLSTGSEGNPAPRGVSTSQETFYSHYTSSLTPKTMSESSFASGPGKEAGDSSHHSTWHTVPIPEMFHEFDFRIRYRALEEDTNTASSFLRHTAQPSCFFIQIQITFPFPAAVVAGVLFDHRALIQQVLDSPTARQQLTEIQIQDLEALHKTHWFSKVRSFSENVSTECPLHQKASYMIEVSCPSQQFRMLLAKRMLRVERRVPPQRHPDDTPLKSAVPITKQQATENRQSTSARECFVISVTELNPNDSDVNTLPQLVITTCGASPHPRQTNNPYLRDISASNNSLPSEGTTRLCQFTSTSTATTTPQSPNTLRHPTVEGKNNNAWTAKASSTPDCLAAHPPTIIPRTTSFGKVGFLQCGNNAVHHNIMGPPSPEQFHLHFNTLTPTLQHGETLDCPPAQHLSISLEYRVWEGDTPSSAYISLEGVLNKRTACIFSSELLGESPEFFKSIWNLIYLCKTLSPFLEEPQHIPPRAIQLARQCPISRCPLSASATRTSIIFNKPFSCKDRCTLRADKRPT